MKKELNLIKTQMIEVIDNFLEEKDFLNIKKILLGEDFPWFYNEEKVLEETLLCDKLNNFQFIHGFFNTNLQISNYFQIISPLIEKINPKSLVRIKANLTPKSNHILKYGFHTDFEIGFGCKTSIFYVNSNDGATVFETGHKINSVENRLITFDSDIVHSGTTCTNQKIRVVININYF